MGKVWTMFLKFLKEYGKDIAIYLLKKWIEAENDPKTVTAMVESKDGTKKKLTVSAKTMKS